MSTPGDKIRRAYLDAGMNRKQFVERLGVAYGTVVNWERGGCPNAKNRRKISQVTGIPAGELFADVDEKTSGRDARRRAQRMSPLGARIRRAYLEAGMNRSELMYKLGVAYSTIVNWERGYVRPNATSLQAISEHTGVSPAELLQGEAGPPAESTVTIRDAAAAAWGHFRRTALGQSMTEAEQRTLAGVRFYGIWPSVVTYQCMLVALRLGTPE